MKLTKDLESLNFLKNKEENTDILPELQPLELKEFTKIKEIRDKIFQEHCL